jgi:hypothetical protein
VSGETRPLDAGVKIYYYTPDTNEPSWGIGMLYTHVRLLRESGINARVLHDRYPFRPKWLDLDAPRAYLNRPSFRAKSSDILVVPEIVAAREPICRIRCRRIVFVQASSLIVAGLRGAKNYRQLGYESALAVMPHIQEILQKHFDMDAALAPPCIAPYFFEDAAVREGNARKRQIVLYPKRLCEDYGIVVSVLRRRLRGSGWRVVELRNKTHRQVARVMREAAFHVNVNCQESFNATVPEAMAAGCIPICYEAFGGRDYLQDGVNAYVFPNHHVFPLLERTLDLVSGYQRKQGELDRVRRGAYKSAQRFTEKQTASALAAYFERLSGV